MLVAVFFAGLIAVPSEASIPALPTALTLTAPSTVYAGATFTLTGQLTVNTTTNHAGIGNATLTLYRYNGTAWVTTGMTTTTDATGGYQSVSYTHLTLPTNREV